MERVDRFQKLALQAYTEGALTFSQPSRYNKQLKLKESLVLQQLEVDNLVRIKTLRHAQHAAAISSGGDAYEHHHDHADAEFQGISDLLFPWIQKKVSDTNVDKYTKMWEDAFGIKVGSKEWDAIVKKYDKISDLYLSKEKGKK